MRWSAREVAADENPPIEGFRQSLDPADQIDRLPDYGEIEPISRAYIAVMDGADVQRHVDFERRVWAIAARRPARRRTAVSEACAAATASRATPEIVAISSIGNTARMPSPMNLRISPP